MPASERPAWKAEYTLAILATVTWFCGGLLALTTADPGDIGIAALTYTTITFFVATALTGIYVFIRG